jgi:hypothetical protein
MIPDCVDKTLANLIDAIDAGALRVSYVASNGKKIDLTKEGLGKLSGWYGGGDEGWILKYSRERFVNDCEDSKGFFDSRENTTPGTHTDFGKIDK